MRAMSYRGPHRVRITDKPVPGIEHSQDAIIEVTRSGICGSDIHLYNGGVPDTHVGMTLGHEVTGVVVDVGPVKVPEWMDLDDAVLLTDVVPTGYQAAEMGGIQPGDAVLDDLAHGHVPSPWGNPEFETQPPQVGQAVEERRYASSTA